MKREELERIGKELKDKYLEETVVHINNRLRLMKKLILEGERILGENDYTDDEIERISQKEIIDDKGLRELSDQYDVDKMSSHSTITKFGYDLENECRDMRNADYEIMKLVLFNKNKRKIKTLIYSDNDPIRLKRETINKALEDAINNKDCKYLIRIHNHPHVLCANTDYQDDKAYCMDRQMLKSKGIRLLDDCIVSVYDFYSRSIK